MFRCVVFGEVISPIVFTTDPTDVSFVLLYLITDPGVAHVNCAGSLLFNSVVSDSIGSGVVSVDCDCFCGYPISVRVVRRMVASLQLTKRAPSSALAAEAATW